MAGIQVMATAERLFANQETENPGGGQRQQTASSNSSGYFELRQLADGEFAVRTLATPRYQSAMARLRAGVDSAVLVVKGVGRDRVRVYGTVTDTQGAPIVGVRVRAPGATGGASTRGDGGYELTLGIANRTQSYSVRFDKDGYRPNSRRLDGAALEDGSEVPLDVTLEAADQTAVVDGAVTDQRGGGIPGASVRLSSSNAQRNYMTRTGETGGFQFPEVELSEDYRLWVRPQSGYQEHVEEPVAVRGSGLFLPVTLDPLQSGTLEGRIVDGAGAPVPGFNLWLRSFSPSEQRTRLVTSDQGGRFRVTDLPEGQVSFSTRSSPYLRADGIDFSPADQDPVELVVDLGVDQAAGVVLDAAGDPVGGAQVTLTWSATDGRARSRSERRTLTDAAGTFLFTQLGPGWHTVSATAPGYQPVRQDVLVGSGQDVTVELRKDPS